MNKNNEEYAEIENKSENRRLIRNSHINEKKIQKKNQPTKSLDHFSRSK